MGLCLPIWFTGQPADTDQGKSQCHFVRVFHSTGHYWEEFASGKMAEFYHETCTLQAEGTALSS